MPGAQALAQIVKSAEEGSAMNRSSSVLPPLEVGSPWASSSASHSSSSSGSSARRVPSLVSLGLVHQEVGHEGERAVPPDHRVGDQQRPRPGGDVEGAVVGADRRRSRAPSHREPARCPTRRARSSSRGRTRACPRPAPARARRNARPARRTPRRWWRLESRTRSTPPRCSSSSASQSSADRVDDGAGARQPAGVDDLSDPGMRCAPLEDAVELTSRNPLIAAIVGPRRVRLRPPLLGSAP